MRILIDTNILLDYLTKREPYEVQAREIVLACKQKKLSACIAAHSVSNIFYILRKDFSVGERKCLLKELCELFTIQGIDKAIIIKALENGDFDDFEDCLQMECAVKFGAKYIVTRNIDDFQKSVIPCIMPDKFCSLMKLGG